MPKFCQPWATQCNIASKFKIEEPEMVVLHLSEKLASVYQYVKSLKLVGVYWSESLAPTYHTTKCHKTMALYLSETRHQSADLKDVIQWCHNI